MEKILNGTVQFKEGDFEAHRDLFEQLEKGQKPHTLFIGCADSRVVPSMITQSLPGELFIVRNVANMVPPYREAKEYLSTTSVIEYALQVLKVENIIVCGHSNCGGCAALMGEPQNLDLLPHTRKWLELASGVKEKVLEQLPQHDPAAREWLTEQTNVLEQMKHLMTYPYIRDRYQKGELTILGWHYIIQTGEVYQYNTELDVFEKLN